MGAAGIIVGIFLVFSFSISWISGERQKTKLENSLKEEKAAKANLERELSVANRRINKDSEQIAGIEEKLRAESAEKTRLEREFVLIERQKKLAGEQGISAGPEAVKEKIRPPAPSKDEITKLEARDAVAIDAGKTAEEKLTQASPAAAMASKESPATGELKEFDVYVIKKGDTLWKISAKKEVFGNPRMWPLLYKYNIFAVAGPDTIKPDIKLIIKRDVSGKEAADAVKKTNARGKWTGPTPHMKNLLMDWLKLR